MNQQGPDDKSVRAWSMQNSLFSGDSRATAATSASAASAASTASGSKRLEMVRELSDHQRVAEPQPMEFQDAQDHLPPVPHHDVTSAQMLPIAASAPRRERARDQPREGQFERASTNIYRSHRGDTRDAEYAGGASEGADYAGDVRQDAKVPAASGAANVPGAVPIGSSSGATSAAAAGSAPSLFPHISSSPPADAPSPTATTLNALAAALERTFQSVAGAATPSVLVTRAALAAQLLVDYGERLQASPEARAATTSGGAIGSIASNIPAPHGASGPAHAHVASHAGGASSGGSSGGSGGSGGSGSGGAFRGPLTGSGAASEAASEAAAVSRILRTTLAFTDCLIRSPNLRSTRMNLLSALQSLGTTLGLVDSDPNAPVQLPRNFALDSSTLHSDLCAQLLEELSRSPPGGITEQEGAYIAPVARGLGPQFAVATLCIGIPHLSEHHWTQVTALQSVCPELHFYARKDTIIPGQQQQFPRVVPPFRTPDPQNPPISISIAPELSNNTSGTLGGYIYPVVEAGSAYEQFKDSTFALTCGHVCLADADVTRNIDKAVMFPSPVLVAMFRRALESESRLHSEHTHEHRAYRQAISELELNPPQPLGSLVWGERDVVTTKTGQLMSDLAIIRCNDGVNCRNILGEDLDLSVHDPGLAFNTSVTHIVPQALCPGLPVFKVGATSKYTNGIVSSARLIYWSNNKLQSTEFVVRSETPIFASGGDSGAWVLSRGVYTGTAGLGVLGMIHSYDGEFKEFGLFTPMVGVLERLEEVTGVRWAVRGAADVSREQVSAANSERRAEASSTASAPSPVAQRPRATVS